MTEPEIPEIREVTIPVSPGELIDKITILEIKAERIDDPVKLSNVSYQLDALRQARVETLPVSDPLSRMTQELKDINEALWDSEAEIRSCESAKDFGARFVELARSIYLNNDKRVAIKKRIDALFGAAITEEKSYPDY